jgi:hypothetical protein
MIMGKQGGRILLAGAEGTAFEIAKGRYADGPNFDVYLKGHSGDPLRTNRTGRASDIVDHPALTLALAVQPDVIQGLAEHVSMRGRGFLARPLYSMPASIVGRRRVGATPVPASVAAAYHENLLRLWRLPTPDSPDGAYHFCELKLSPAADLALRGFEAWLEPQLAQGEELSHLAGWANKLAGQVARVGAVLHMAAEVGTGMAWLPTVEEQIICAAIKLGRDYLLPHAQAAFGVMGADPRTEQALHVIGWLKKKVIEWSEWGKSGVPRFSRRDIHQANRWTIKNPEELERTLELLCKHGYLAMEKGSGQVGKGHKSPVYLVNPTFVAACRNGVPRSHPTHSTHS